jgi:hypothetical protein
MMADACLGTARLEGLGTVMEALAVANKNEDRAFEPELLRLKGELLLRQDDSN